MSNTIELYSELLSRSRGEIAPRIVFDPKLKDWDFDPSINKLKIPFVSPNLDSETQQGYIFSACCNFMCSSPSLWGKADERGISRFIYTWLNQIRSEREFKKVYPMAQIVLQRFYWNLKLPTLDSTSSFFMRMWVFEKFTAVPEQAEPAKWSLKEREMCHRIVHSMRTDKEFLEICEDLQILFQEAMDNQPKPEEEEQVPESDNPVNKQAEEMCADAPNIMGEYAKMVEEAKAGILPEKEEDHPLIVKNFDGNAYSKFYDDFHYSPSECLKMHETPFINEGLDKYLDELKESSIYTNHKALELYGEFQVMKSAIEYSRTRLDESGELDMNRLALHRISNEIFMEDIISNDGTSHAICFFVDFSVSMFHESKFIDTMRQVLILQKFCALADIKHSVIGFADTGNEEEIRLAINHGRTHAADNDKMSIQKYIDLFRSLPVNTVVPPPGMKLYELFNDTMQEQDRKRMENLIMLMMETATNGQLTTEFQFGRTPMSNTVLFTRDAISGILERDSRIQKISLMLISDQATDECCYVNEERNLQRRTKDAPLDRIQIFDKNETMVFYKENALDLLRLVKRSFELDGVNIECVLFIPGAGRVHAPSIMEYQKFLQNGVMSKQHEPGITSIWLRSTLGIYKESMQVKNVDFVNNFRLATSQDNITRTFVKQFLEHWA